MASDSARPTQSVHAGQEVPVRRQFDGNRHPEPPWTSLTRKRSLVQIQYGPQVFSKTRLAVGARMRARHLRVCSIPAGHQVFVNVFVASGCHGGWMPLTANDGSAMTRDKPRTAPVRPGLRALCRRHAPAIRQMRSTSVLCQISRPVAIRTSPSVGSPLQPAQNRGSRSWRVTGCRAAPMLPDNCTITNRAASASGRRLVTKMDQCVKTCSLAGLLGQSRDSDRMGWIRACRVLGRQARARPMRWRFFSTDPGSTVKCTCPSSSMATTRTTACA